ncbi:MAG: Trk system potassium transporter TrkA [Desulfovibrionaceae bacterium]|jgi:trk system potassium uptake protein TrkA|nr:Trk system potassium transporter TrkA [Desulfovibrionaceae bacterium]
MKLFGRSSASSLKVIVVGAGEVGFHISQRLAMEHKQVVVIDKNPDALRRISENLDVQTLLGSGSSPMILDQAGISDADILLAVTDSDETNIIACIFANILSPKTLKLARIRNEEYTLYREALSNDTVNIGMVINPEVEVVKTIDRLLSLPGAVESSDFANGKIKMVGVRVEQGEMIGTPMTHVREKVSGMSLIIGAIVREERLIIPQGNDVIKKDDLVYFACERKDVEKMLHIFGCISAPIKSILIVGGGNIGLRLASFFERKGYHTKLVERDPERCVYLSEKLDTTLVLQGDGTDRDMLEEENVRDMDVVVSLTGDEETNILSCLLAKSLGARKAITRVNKFAYLPLVRAIGIEHSVSTRLSAINSILQYVRRGKVISSVSIKGEEAEAMEAIAQENSEIVGKPLRLLDFPKGALILCVIRGDEVLIPTGDTVINPQDRIVILSTRQTVSKVEQALMVKLEYY